MPPSHAYRPDPRHHLLGDAFFDRVRPASVSRVTLRWRNQRAAAEVGLDSLDEAEWEAAFARFAPLPGNLPEPLALRYHGHQFGSYNPNLGDGRGFLHAQLRDGTGRLLDLGTKGSGTTPWSRGGDGRLTLKGGVREVLATELLEALGVNTSRSFSLYETHEALVRHDEPSPARASVLVRLNHSHVRIGTFQRLAWHRDTANLERLVAWCLDTYHPRAPRRDAAGLLDAVARATGRTTAQWMTAGFVHGVLNTDNVNVTGESFDYGPWRFLPAYDREFTAAYFDHTGFYAYGRQPEAMVWNLGRLADCLLPLSTAPELAEAIASFKSAYGDTFRHRLLGRLGVRTGTIDDDHALIRATLAFLDASRVPFEPFFFDWLGGTASRERALGGPRAGLYRGQAWTALWELLGTRDPLRPERLDHPVFQAKDPPWLHIDVVEALWARIAADDDWAPFYAHIDAMRAYGQALDLARDTPDP